MSIRSDRAARLERSLKANDIRGRVGLDLDADLLVALGMATAQVMRELHGAGSVVIGSDMRVDSPNYAGLLAAGVVAAGSRPVYVGMCSTDQLYYASGAWEVPGLMVTASHNPQDYNGVKFCGPGAAGMSAASGLDRIAAAAFAAVVPADPRPLDPDPSSATALATGYAQRIRGLTGLGTGRRLRIVADCGNGMAGKLLPEVFGAAAGLPELEHEVIGLFTELDGTFPNHPANPLEPENLAWAQRGVVERRADIGLAFDGDADRCFFIDETGRATSASAIGALVATREIARVRGLGEEHPAVLHNLLTSRSVARAIEAAGGRAVRTPVGHSGIKQTMRRENGIFACEHSAHFYFRDFFSADSGMLAAAHIIAALERTEKTLSELLAEFAPAELSGEHNSRVAQPDAVLDNFAAAAASGDFGRGDLDRMDGVTLQGEDFWINVRKSNTEPLVRFNCETPSVERTQDLTQRVLELIRA